MSEQPGETTIAEGSAGVEGEVDGSGVICPECGKRLKDENSLKSHIWRQHNPDRPKTTRQRTATAGGQKGAELNRLRRQLKQNVQALSLLPFMARGTSDRLTDPRITAILEEKSEAFADAWIAVAETNDYVRRNLALILSGGVWLNAAAQTAALGYVVAVFAGVVPMQPGAMMLLPEMRQFYPPPPATSNGAPPPPPQEETVGDQGA